jgi:hypothetical protein
LQLASPGILLSDKKKLKKRKKGISRQVSFNLSKNTSKIIDSSFEELERSRREAEKLRQEQIAAEVGESNEIAVKKKKKKKEKKESNEEEIHEVEKRVKKNYQAEEPEVGKKSKKKKKKDYDQGESAEITSEENPEVEHESKKKKKKKRKDKDESPNGVEEKCDIEPESKKKKKKQKKGSDECQTEEVISEKNCDINPEIKKKKKKKKEKEKDENLNEVEDRPVEIKLEPESPDFKDVASSNLTDDQTVKLKKKKKKKDHENEENIVGDENGLEDQPTKAKKTRKEDEIDGNDDDLAEPKKKKKKNKEKKEDTNDDPKTLPKTKSKDKKKHKNQEIPTPDDLEIDEVPSERKRKKKKKKETEQHLSDIENTEAEPFNPTVIKPIKEMKKKKIKKKASQDDDDSPIPIPVYTSTPAPSIAPAFRNQHLEPMQPLGHESDSEDEEIDKNLSQISSIMQEPCTIPANIMNLDDPDDLDTLSSDAGGTESDSVPRLLSSYEDRAKDRDIFGRPIFAKRMAQLPEVKFDFSHLERCCDYVLHMDWQDSPSAKILHSLPYRRIGKEELDELKARGEENF